MEIRMAIHSARRLVKEMMMEIEKVKRMAKRWERRMLRATGKGWLMGFHLD